MSRRTPSCTPGPFATSRRSGQPWRNGTASSGGRGPEGDVLTDGNGAEGVHLFPGSELNYVDHVLRQPAGDLALIAVDEAGSRQELTYGELTALAGAAAAGLSRLGVVRRRPGRRRAAERSTGHRCLPRSGQSRGHLVGLRAGVRRVEHGGPLPTESARAC